MKIMLLANANSVHTQRWAKSLADKGVEIFVFTLSKVEKNPFEAYKNIQLYSFGFSEEFTKSKEGRVAKIRYIKVLPKLRKKITQFKPNILHAHYASGYGSLATLSVFHPMVISVWGSDVYDFPKQSFFHRKLIEFNFSQADKILSTSHIMAKETKLYTNKEIIVTPFGIDLDLFKPMEINTLFNKGDIVIGTVKTLEEIYGIEYLIKAFKIVVEKYPDLPLKLLIVGGGSLEMKLTQLTKDLQIDQKTIFTGQIDYKEIPKYHNMLSISVSVSNSESFGVAIIEASACEKPVVVSDVGGLPEVVEDGVTGYIVQPRSSIETAKAIEKLLIDKSLRIQMGIDGRKRVKKLYNWEENVNQMIDIYRDVIG